MCFGPSGANGGAGAPIPERQAAHAPDASFVAARASDVAKRRMGYAASILTPLNGPGLASTTGKSLLGG